MDLQVIFFQGGDDGRGYRNMHKNIWRSIFDLESNPLVL